MKKIKFIPNADICKNHRNGWSYVCEIIEQSLHTPYGLDFYSWADRFFKEVNLSHLRPWSGFIHNVISYPSVEYPMKYKARPKLVFSLEQLVARQELFNTVMSCCQGFFTLCDHTANFLRKYTSVPIQSVYYPSPKCIEFKRVDNRIVFIGQHLRKYHSFVDLRLPYNFEKVMIQVKPNKFDYQEMLQYTTAKQPIKFICGLSNKSYDEILESSIVFLDFYDVAGCTVVVECIMANTPLVVRRLPALEEYLGVDYPLFYNSLEDAEDIITDIGRINNGIDYLRSMDKNIFSSEYFIESIVMSQIYTNIKPMKVL